MRLKSEMWVKAYLRARAGDNIMAVLSRRGDPDAGAIFILVHLLDGMCQLYGPAPAGLAVVDRERRWVNCFADETASQEVADAYIQQQSDMDPDLWLIEVEDSKGRHYLGDAFEPAADI